MQVRFGTKFEHISYKYTRKIGLTNHVSQCQNTWSSRPKEEWTHRVIHTLDMILKNWYLELEMYREIMNYDMLTQSFKVAFTFENESPLIDAVLQNIKTKIFLKGGPMEVVYMCRTRRDSLKVHKLLEFYYVSREDRDEEDPRDIQVLEIEGECTIEGPYLESVAYSQPLRT
jgi:hypothetical protein